MEVCNGHSSYSWIYALAWLAYAVLEWWLGKTNKVRASSTLEVLAVGMVTLLVTLMFKLRRKTDD